MADQRGDGRECQRNNPLSTAPSAQQTPPPQLQSTQNGLKKEWSTVIETAAKANYGDFDKLQLSSGD